MISSMKTKFMSNCMLRHKLCFIYLLLGCCSLMAAPKEKPKAEKDSIAYHGSYVGIDLVSVGQAALSDSWNLSAQYDINLYNKYIPCVELGYGQGALQNDLNTQVSSHGFFGKIGVNLPIAYYGKNAENMFFAGIRYGMSHTAYQIKGATFQSGYWGDAYTANFMDEKSFAHWGEVVGGLRIQLVSNLSVGWTLRIKKLFSASPSNNSVPPYIQGFGQNTGDMATNFAFYLYYRFPW